MRKGMFTTRKRWLSFDRMPGYWWLHLGGLVVYGKNLMLFPLSFSERKRLRTTLRVRDWLFGAYRD